MTPPLLLTMPGFDHTVEAGHPGLEVAPVEPARFAKRELVLRRPRPAAERRCGPAVLY